MFIQTEQTPNPATLKFLPGSEVLVQGSLEFVAGADLEKSPLAQRLFTLTGVERLFFGADFVSVSKANDTDWTMLKPMVLNALMEHFATGQPVMVPGYAEELSVDEHQEEDELVIQIKELIDTRVRPAVAMDGGDIVFDRFEDGVVFLHMRGACSGCPSSTMTLKSGIENMLKHFVPEVEEVRPVTE